MRLAGLSVEEDRPGLRIGLESREGAMGEDEVGFTRTDQPQTMPAGHAVAIGNVPLRRRAIGIGATALELLLPLTLQWARSENIALPQALAAVTSRPAQILGSCLGTDCSIGQLTPGGVADICIVNPDAGWTVGADTLRSQSKFTPFEGQTLQGRVIHTLVSGQLAFAAAAQ